MSAPTLPEPLACPPSWKYTEAWADEYNDEHGYDYLNQICGHSRARFNILYFIWSYGEDSLTKVKSQNLLIKRLANSTKSTKDIDDSDCEGGTDPSWNRIDEIWEELFEIYNAQLAPPDIVALLNEVHGFMVEGSRHSEEILRYVKAEQEENAPKPMGLSTYLKIDPDLELNRRRAVQREATQSKWDGIDEKHSHVAEGFVYVMTNALMPGVFKVGFTAGNPDKRAKELSAQYNLPSKFEVLSYWRTNDPYIVEQRIHTALEKYAKGGEFFQLPMDEITATVESFLISAKS